MLSAQSCPALFDPTDCSLLGSSVRGISQARYWNGLPFPSSGDHPDPGIEHMSPALADGFITTESPGKVTRIDVKKDMGSILISRIYCEVSFS